MLRGITKWLKGFEPHPRWPTLVEEALEESDGLQQRATEFVMKHINPPSSPSSSVQSGYFSLTKCVSVVPSAGQGLFLKGKAAPGTVLTMYPGTIYLPGDPQTIPSFRNSYFLRLSNGSSIDGLSFSLSRSFQRVSK